MYERMLDKQIKPSLEAMADYCGENGERFILLNQWLEKTFETEQQIVFPYGNQYGWGVAHRKKRKLLCNVFAEDNGFTVMLRLSDRQYKSVYEQLRTDTRELIDNKYPCGDGGWIHYRVAGPEQFEDIQVLLTVKCS